LTAGPRFTRQVRLAEVGEEGQARLEGALVRVEGDGLAGRVEARYLRGAGVGVVGSDPTIVPADAPAWLTSLTPAARDVASGAYAALDVIRAVLADASHPRVDRPVAPS
jgi:hypothetical protein